MTTQYIELPIAEPHGKGTWLSFNNEDGSIFSLTNVEVVIKDCLVTINGEQDTLEINCDTNAEAIEFCLKMVKQFGITYREESK